ncbi:MAG: hypothetical protein SGI72_00815 [Planctomycetota bacterium]|nr:hypothetical protein [Planctomycetota bacterium]
MTKSDLPERLAFYFGRNGYLRAPRDDRREDGHQVYKKGWEVRLVLHDVVELVEAQRLIERAGMRPGKPFHKRLCWIQPIYGREAVMRFKSVPCEPHKKRMKAGALQSGARRTRTGSRKSVE